MSLRFLNPKLTRQNRIQWANIWAHWTPVEQVIAAFWRAVGPKLRGQCVCVSVHTWQRNAFVKSLHSSWEPSGVPSQFHDVNEWYLKWGRRKFAEHDHLRWIGLVICKMSTYEQRRCGCLTVYINGRFVFPGFKTTIQPLFFVVLSSRPL